MSKKVWKIRTSARLAPAYEDKIMTIAEELGITEPIVLRKMNTNALKVFGYCNAFAASPNFLGILPFVDTQFLFISEGFFEDLSEKEQRFLIGHELIHIKERHTKYIQLIMVLFVFALTFGWLCVRKRIGAILAAYISEPYRAPALFGAGLFSVCMFVVISNLMHCWYRRHIEWQADHQSLLLLHSHEGGVSLMERWMKEFNMPQIYPYWGLFSTHPSHYERRAYCLAHKHSVTREVI